MGRLEIFLVDVSNRAKSDGVRIEKRNGERSM